MRRASWRSRGSEGQWWGDALLRSFIGGGCLRVAGTRRRRARPQETEALASGVKHSRHSPVLGSSSAAGSKPGLLRIAKWPRPRHLLFRSRRDVSRLVLEEIAAGLLEAASAGTLQSLQHPQNCAEGSEADLPYPKCSLTTPPQRPTNSRRRRPGCCLCSMQTDSRTNGGGRLRLSRLCGWRDGSGADARLELSRFQFSKKKFMNIAL